MKGGDDIEGLLHSPMMEPRLVVFYYDDNSLQMFLCAENSISLEVPATKYTLIDGLIHLMAMYYVFDVQYPSFCRSTLFFLQDIVMKRPDTSKRPTRYMTFIENHSL